jgi:carbon-monoxide dehydrogenase medium subunit
MLHSFQHHRPQRQEDALELMVRFGEDAAFVAGGTELLLAMKARVLRYDHLVDLKGLAELRGVTTSDNGILIGALSSHHALANDASVRSILPAYARLSDNVANIRVRVQGTIGGNLCFAEPHADPPTLLGALDAQLRLRGPGGDRTIPVLDFIEGEFTTKRAPDEILTHVFVPKPLPGARYAYHSFGHLERPAVSVAVGYVPVAGRATYRVVAGALTRAPQQLAGLAAQLEGVSLQDLNEAVASIVEPTMSELDTDSDLLGSADYKRHLAGVMLKRACAEIAQTDLRSKR